MWVPSSQGSADAPSAEREDTPGVAIPSPPAMWPRWAHLPPSAGSSTQLHCVRDSSASFLVAPVAVWLLGVLGVF